MALHIKDRDGTADSLRKKARQYGWLSLARGIYWEPGDDLDKLVFTQWRDIVHSLYPDAIVSHRTAISLRPEKGTIFVTRPVRAYRNSKVGPLSIAVTPGDVEIGTRPVDRHLHASGDARAWLENLSASRRRGAVPRALGQEALEAELDKVLARRGEEFLKGVRQEAKEMAPQLGLVEEYRKLDAIIGALCATRPFAGILKTEQGIARANRKPIDPHIVDCFDGLVRALANHGLPALDTRLDQQSWRNQAFIESYFSNYIEGTRFPLTEAQEIVFERKLDESRHADSHDILALYDLAVDTDEMIATPSTADEFQELLIRRHEFLMHDRPDKRPGQWKEKSNRVGTVVFAPPETVNGCLTQGFERYQDLPAGFARAVFVHFVVTQVHPFDDGNGRLARLFLSAELVSAGQSKIIFPNVKRDDYINGLRLANRDREFRTMLKVMTQLYRYTDSLPWRDFDELVSTLESHHAFDGPDDGLMLFSRALQAYLKA